MQELEKILEEIKVSSVYAKTRDGYGALCVPIGTIERIIRKHMNGGWIPVEERLPEGEVNPITQDYYGYQVTAKFGETTDIRTYQFGNGHWWHGAGIMDDYVIAWREHPEPYRPERRKDGQAD